MYDPKFEKAVQQKMEELEFRPSESVWVNIEKTVSAERRRRGIPIFWRWMAPAVLLTAVGGAYYFGLKAGRKAAAPAVIVATKPEGANAGTAVGTGASVKGVVAEKKVAELKVVIGRQHAPVMVKQHAPGVAKTTDMPVAGKQDATAAVTGTVELSGAPDGMERKHGWPGLANQRLYHGVSGAAPGKSRGLVNLNALSKVKRPWEAGFAAGGGIDRLNSVNSERLANAVSYMASSLYSLSRASIGKGSVSDMRPDVSYYAGVYLQKGISDRWTFHAGLDLHYYSTRLSVGQPMNIVASPSASLLNLNAPLAAAPAAVVYTVGTRETYTNRYYMLALPVAMQYRLNRSTLLPLFLEGGASVSRLMGANAILYNPGTGLYLKNENALNKTQIAVSSALLVGLPFHGIRIQAGPEVQYGLTPLIDAQGLGDQHFLYTGIRLVVLPGRR